MSQQRSLLKAPAVNLALGCNRSRNFRAAPGCQNVRWIIICTCRAVSTNGSKAGNPGSVPILP